jgi:mannose-1-phosphate guanylyltransferase
MIQSTVSRLGSLVSPEQVLVVTNAALAAEVRRQLPNVPAASIVGEPCKRDTAPCIGLAAMLVQKQDPDGTMMVMPSDHVIQPESVFQNALRFAADLVDAAPQRIVTFGITPTYPAESFGYIERGNLLPSTTSAYQVLRFREKPKAEVARDFVAAGTFYWNSGIFVWKARTILDALKKHQPDLHARIEAIGAALGKPNYAEVFEREFTAIKPISIDYAVMEHAQDVVVVEAPFAWDDVGSWQAISRLQELDGDGNAIRGKHLGLNTQGSIVRGPDDHLIVTLGLKDCMVVHTKDATLVANKHDEESIRHLVKMLSERGWKEYL